MLKMYVEMAGTVNGLSFLDYKQSCAGMSFGGYCFDIVINGKQYTVDFDFPGYAAFMQEDGKLILEAGAKTIFGRNDFLDDCYDSEYKSMGISRDDLSASVLASATKINEFVIDCDGKIEFQILSITFIDDTGTYNVDQEVINQYNKERNGVIA